jgi:uncharacterized membrane protein
MSWIELVRWAHVIAGVGWVGAVFVVVFVLGPALQVADRSERVLLLARVFPRVFRLASALVVVGLLSGAALFLHRYGLRPDLALLTASGRSLLAGGVLGAVVGTFHFVIEPRLELKIARTGSSDAVLDQLVWLLRLIPRAGLIVLLLVTVLMMSGARGWW